ncbi:N-acetyltransferase GCN5 [Anopheles sinensis]|uniref:N-acetyltransferase GCN5 n=1 Tax=Anopheles sinensis TaxID=74873 RepID=A0A084WEA3_ANOSI|nr:N-acetyltransferase GCN5 [Anopheles sinensis]
MAIKAKVIAWVLFITYFSTIMQAIVYQRSDPQLPEVYSVPAHSEWGLVLN